MRQETIVKTYLKFTELSEAQQDKVVDKYDDINVDEDTWYESTYEYYEDKLRALGFYDIKFEFSGFWSQGDGASFTAKHNRGTIYKSSRYSHSGTMQCDDNKALLMVARRMADKLYKSLQSEYDYLTSKETIIETIKANDYEFDQETLKLA